MSRHQRREKQARQNDAWVRSVTGVFNPTKQDRYFAELDWSLDEEDEDEDEDEEYLREQERLEQEAYAWLAAQEAADQSCAGA